MNLFEADLHLSGEVGTVTLGSHVVALPSECLVKAPATARLRRSSHHHRDPARGLRGRGVRTCGSRVAADHLHGVADRGARIGAHGALPHRRADRRLRRPRRRRGEGGRAACRTPSAGSTHGRRRASATRSRWRSPPRTCTSSTWRPARPSKADVRSGVRHQLATSALDGAGEDAAHEVALQREEHDQRDEGLHERAGRQDVLVPPEVAGEVGDEDRRRLLARRWRRSSCWRRGSRSTSRGTGRSRTPRAPAPTAGSTSRQKIVKWLGAVDARRLEQVLRAAS